MGLSFFEQERVARVGALVRPPAVALRASVRRKLVKRLARVVGEPGAFLRAEPRYTDAQLQSIAREHGVSL